MLQMIQALEERTAPERRRALLDCIGQIGWPVELHEYREWMVPTANLVLTKQGKLPKEILLLAHYDTYHGSPGANDNASGVVVLLDAFDTLSKTPLHCTLRAIVFDDEEPTLVRPRPCLGSRKWVGRNGVENVAGVFCLELCGLGDAVVIWPVSESGRSTLMLNTAVKTFDAQGIPYDTAPQLPGFTSDFMSFRKAGVSEAFCFTAAPRAERDRLLQLFGSSLIKLLFTVEIPKRLGCGNHLPEMIRRYHTNQDTSDSLSESSLQMMSKALVEVIRAYDREIANMTDAVPHNGAAGRGQTVTENHKYE
jgi:hypothetical protein